MHVATQANDRFVRKAAVQIFLVQRSHGAAEIWGEVRDWLEAHGVVMPEGIDPVLPVNGAQRDQ